MRKHLATFVEDFESHGKQIAIVSYPGNRRVVTSYLELATLAGRFSRALSDRGISPGERVLLWGANSAAWVAAFFGCVLRGVVVVPLDAAGSPEFTARVITDVAARLIVGDQDLLCKLSEFPPKIALQDFAAILPGEPLLQPEPSLDLETPLQILFTSGTTSTPKGIVHTHGNVLASVDVLEREIGKYLRYERWVHPLRFLHTLPLSHVFGQFMGLWVPPLLAAEVHYEEKLVASHLIERIRRERISVAAVVPRVLELMRASLLAADPALEQRLITIQHQRIWWRWWHLRGLHRRFGFKFWAFVSGGAWLPEDVEQFWNALGFVLVQGYGMTETTALATLNHPLHTTRGSIGKPLAGREVRVADDGEILVRGAIVAAGTWRNGRMEPRREEWLHTGDLGTVDAEGQMHFIGRKSDIIVAASGMNIHPADLEAVVRAQPGVRDCVVVGWDGPRGAEPVSAVILESSSESERTDGSDKAPFAEILDRIVAGANRSLQEFQQIHSALRWPAQEFPHNSMGKLLRREVAAWVRQQLLTEAPPAALHSNQDPLLRLLEQVTGQSAEGMQDSAALDTGFHLDSLGRMQLAMGIEEQFGIAVGDEEVVAAKTLGDLRNLLRQGTRKGQAPSDQEERSNEPQVSKESAQQSRLSVQRARHAASSNPRYPPEDEIYPRWPWCAPVQAVRVVFLECVLRPLVAVLAHPRVQRASKTLPQQPSIYVCNHVTILDVPFVLFALPRCVRQHMSVAMSAELLAAWRHGHTATGVGPGLLRWLAPLQVWVVTALFNVFPLPVGAGLRRSFAHAGEALDHGYNVLVFPEGRRTTDGSLQPFQTGISLLAQESGTVVVPVGLGGLWHAARPVRLRPSGLFVAVGLPLQQTSGESYLQFAVRLRSVVEDLVLGRM